MKSANHYNARTSPTPQELGPFFSGFLEEIRRTPTEDLFQTMVATGIYTKSGELTKEYGGTAEKKRKSV